MRKTEILKIKGDWQEVVDDCRATVKKSPLGKEPRTAFKKSIHGFHHQIPIRKIYVLVEPIYIFPKFSVLRSSLR